MYLHCVSGVVLATEPTIVLVILGTVGVVVRHVAGLTDTGGVDMDAEVGTDSGAGAELADTDLALLFDTEAFF